MKKGDKTGQLQIGIHVAMVMILNPDNQQTQTLLIVTEIITKLPGGTRTHNTRQGVSCVHIYLVKLTSVPETMDAIIFLLGLSQSMAG